VAFFFSRKKNNLASVMGATFCKQEFEPISQHDKILHGKNVERYFRPSCLPILNDRFPSSFFDPYYDKKPNEIKLSPSLMASPDNTIINYFSVLREAENLSTEKIAGCGTIGNSKIPYPVSYQFLTSDYQKRFPYNSYLKSFEDIAHINLIKLKRIPDDKNHPHTIPYFIELETIEGSTKRLTYFAYYFGFIYLRNEGNCFKIEDMELFGEDFLCAAYHLWQHNAEEVVDIKYGNWCHLVKKRLPTKQDGYVKNIDVIGTDGNEYRFVFFQLTNDTDIFIAQYKRNTLGKWEQIEMDPEKCVKVEPS
jgi:hypothetical protein